MKNYTYKVCTRCMTFNQKTIIQDALRGFCMQKTSFPVVFAIVDDASTDGEPELLRQWSETNLALNEKGVAYKEDLEYGNLLFARHKDNRYLFFVILLLNYNHYSKGLSSKKKDYISKWMNDANYLSSCEGDDYWTHPEKLQRQVDFLESHPDYTMCFHRAEVIVESGDYSNLTNDMYDDLEEREYSGIELAQRWRVPTASIMYRSFIKPPHDKRLLTGDIPLILQCASEGRVYCFSESMSVYRRTSGGVSLKKYSKLQLVDKVLAYINYFPQFKNHYEKALISLMGKLYFSTHFFEALQITFKRKTLIKYSFLGIFNELLFIPKMVSRKVNELINSNE